ncbi:MAG: lipopolysaccharide transport periplasmic protein LptA [candidate division NC10 bacterium]
MRWRSAGLLLLLCLGPGLMLASPAAESQTAPGAKKKDTAREVRATAVTPVTIDADQMESLKKEGLVIFTGNVIARQNSSVHYADRMEVYLGERDEKIHRIISTGNVKIITKDCRTGTARRAEYYDDEQKVLLIGNARVWQEDNLVTGERITIFLAEDRSVVETGAQGRVHAIFYPKSEGKKESQAKGDVKGGKAAATPCA